VEKKTPMNYREEDAPGGQELSLAWGTVKEGERKKSSRSRGRKKRKKQGQNRCVLRLKRTGGAARDED